MASSPNLTRSRTHTLSDDHSHLLPGRVPRRKSASSLPASSAAPRKRHPNAPTTSPSASATPPPLPLRPQAGSRTAPTTPSVATASATTFGPWGGTFLDADADADVDADADADADSTEDANDTDAADRANTQSGTGGAGGSFNFFYAPNRSANRSALALSSDSTAAQPPPPQELSQPTQAAQEESPVPQLTLPSSSSARDSFISILEDPFFQRYDTAANDWCDTDDRHLSVPPHPADPPFDHDHDHDHDHVSGNVAPAADPVETNPSTHADGDKTPLAPSTQSAWPLPEHDAAPPPQKMASAQPLSSRLPFWKPKRKVEQINVVVIGAQGVGKTTFIQRALRLPRLPPSGTVTICLDIEGQPHLVALVELDLDHFDLDPHKKINWPRQIGGHMIPRIDGALMLYNVTDKDSIRNLPSTLSALHNTGLPTVLVATKCDSPESTRQLDPDAVATVFPTILTDFKTSANNPATTQDCLQTIVLAASCKQKGIDPMSINRTMSSTRRRAASSAAHLDTPPESQNGRPLSGDQSSSKHSRASSDLSLLRAAAAPASADRDTYYRSQNARPPRIEFPVVTHSSVNPDGTDNHAGQPLPGLLRFSSNGRLDAGQASFLDIEESDAESVRYSDDFSLLQRNDDVLYEQQQPKAIGTTFDELVDRLLAPPTNRADADFAKLFLCLYRKFASPHQLLVAIIARFDRTWSDASIHYLERTAIQFYMIEVLADWVSTYPGDFARPSSRNELEMLVDRLADEPVFVPASQLLWDHLKNDVVEDDNTAWEKSDDPPDPKDAPAGADAAGSNGGNGGNGASNLSRDASGSSVNTPASNGSWDALPSESMRSLTLESSPRDSDASALPAADVVTKNGYVDFHLYSHEDYERESASLVPGATLPLTKFRYHIFMDMDAHDVADEMTRIDWIMFSSTRIRDIVRHVSLSQQEKAQCQSLSSVNRMIAHFNHVAKWVTNMILIRDKAKHRAPVMQKFMQIAQRLRELKNYNSLAAVLAGINGTAIHRLAQTRALVDADVQKRFARLVLLMSSQKSHFAYRMAWDNSTPPRIPFMPLHRGDLVNAEEGSRTFVGPQGDRINWRKFEVMGAVLLPLMRSQVTPYQKLHRNPAVREMVLDCRMPADDEELYQRSVQVEPPSATAELKKKFPWLPK